MKFVAISDTHGCHRNLDLPSGDVLLHAGDVCDRANREHVADFLVWFSELDFEHKILVRGNHDVDLTSGESLLDTEMPEGVVQLENSQHFIEEIPIWGIPFPLSQNRPDLDLIPSETQILISHQPPYTILDSPPFGGPKGDSGLLRAVKSVEPKVHLFGHIHRSYGQTTIGNTLFINASGYKASKKMIVNMPVTFEI
ncbi:MAG: metallophosphatase domain-containing protein [Mariniblastus sp.]